MMTAHGSQYRELEPHDRVLAAVIRQAIKDYQPCVRRHCEPAQSFLTQLGLLNDAGEVAPTDDLALMLTPEHETA